MRAQASKDAHEAMLAQQAMTSAEPKKTYPREAFREEIDLEGSDESGESQLETGVEHALPSFETGSHEETVNTYMDALAESFQSSPEESRALVEHPATRPLMAKYVSLAERHMMARTAQGEQAGDVAADLDKKMRDAAFGMVLRELAQMRAEQKRAA